MPFPFSISSSIVLARIALFFTSTHTQSAEESVETLSRFNVEQKPTVSGYSSGADMAIQLQVAYSRNVAASACFGSTWYRCAPNGYQDFSTVCSLGLNNVTNGIRDAKKFESEGKIDPLVNLENGTHFHFIANQDEILPDPRLRTESKLFFQGVGMKTKNIELVFMNSDHYMPTENKSDISCHSSTMTEPSIKTTGLAFCGYYGALEGLQHIYNGALTRPSDSLKLQPLRAFDQSAFLDKTNQKYMDKVGYFYVPSKCQGSSSSSCRFHIVLHGCKGSRSFIGADFVTGSGYLEVAEANNIVMLFPQSTPFEGNESGCWDIFGASNSETYATKNGVQVKALGKIIETSTGLCLA